MDKRPIYRTGRPGDVIGSRVTGFRRGEGMLLYLTARGYDGLPLANPFAQDAFYTFADTEGGMPFLEFHSLSADPVTLIDADNSQWLFDLDPSLLTGLVEYGEYHFDGWTFDGATKIHQDKGVLRVLPSIEADTQPSLSNLVTIQGGIATLGGEQVSIGE